jgi:dihydrofolate synthase/folylpolyglutamate synthase
MLVNSNFLSFIKDKTNEYAKIDKKRFSKFYKKIKHHIKLPITIHILGTNGKGSTGRFLAYYLYKSGFHVGHFTSPHIKNINERFWINNHNITDITLDLLHKRAISITNYNDLLELSYFEYLTFLAFLAFENLDYAIFEAGLGGEYDATTVINYDLSLVTKIGLDHIEFLGSSIKQIAKTKLKAIKEDAFIASQDKTVKQIAQKILKNPIFTINCISNREIKQVKNYLQSNKMPSFLEQNLFLALCAIKYFKINFNFNLMQGIELEGRFQKISKNVIIDVGHNSLAALAIKKELKRQKIVLIYNTYKDKDYQQILQILKPNIDKLSIIKVNDDRMLPLMDLQAVAKKLNIKYDIFTGIDSKNKYVVFGSFLVVKRFLEIEK